MRWLRLVIILFWTGVAVAACGGETTQDPGEGEGGRRFVTEQRPTTVATVPGTLVPTTVVEVSQPTLAPTVSAQQLLVPRGAPGFVYLRDDAGLVVYDANLRSFTPVAVPDGVRVHDFSSSPTGDRVGVLGLQDGRVHVQFFGAGGEPLGDQIALAVALTPLTTGSPVASPVASPVNEESAFLNIDWIPQGNAVLVSGPGVLQRVSMDGAVMPVSRTGATGLVSNGIWSPMDSQVVIQTETADGHHSVFVLDSGHDEVDELEVLHDSTGSSVTNLQWLPSGLGLILVAGNMDQGDLMNGQLYVYRFGDLVPMLLATSGQGGPAATITHAVVSPDGNSVAYTIMVRDLDEWFVHSLWVRPLRGGAAVSIPVASDAPVTSLAWSTEGLVWQQADGSISVVDGQLHPRPLGQEPPATPSATPLASPVASPVWQSTPRG